MLTISPMCLISTANSPCHVRDVLHASCKAPVMLQPFELVKSEAKTRKKFSEMLSLMTICLILSAAHCTCTSQFLVSHFCEHNTRQPCVTHDLGCPSQTDGTLDMPWPMALFIWHNTQTLAFSPISPPVVTSWSDHTSPPPSPSPCVVYSDTAEACFYSMKIRVLNHWLRLAALIFWSAGTSAFLLAQMCLYIGWWGNWCCALL